MSKLKSHSGTKKRARRTGSGKIVLKRSRRNHLLQQKSKRQKNLPSTLSPTSNKACRNIARLLPYS